MAVEGKSADAPAEAEGEVETELEACRGEELLRMVLEEHEARLPAPAPARIDGVVVGVLAAIEPDGAIRVTHPYAPEGSALARAMTPLGAEDVGRDVALLFEGGDPARPVVMGKMHAPAAALPGVSSDGERIELRAEKEIVLACGDASITLTRAGKVLIRGAYVLSRSSGVHRIQGGSVQIN